MSKQYKYFAQVAAAVTSKINGQNRLGKWMDKQVI